MPCSYARMSDERDRLGESEFLKSALVIGGEEALSTAVSRHGSPAFPDEPVRVDRGVGQHVWTADPIGLDDESGCPAHPGGSDDAGNRTEGDASECPAHDEEIRDEGSDPDYHLLFHLDYAGEEPTREDRAAVERALTGLELAFGWAPDGVLFALGYSTRYFDRLVDPLPEAVRDAIAVAGTDPQVRADGARVESADHDALLHLAGDDPRRLLAAEAALWGDTGAVDVTLGGTFEGVFDRPREPPARRAAFTGPGAVPSGRGVAIGEGGGSFAGGAVARVASLPVTEDADGDGAEDCPAHGDDASDTGGEGVTRRELYSLNPAEPACFHVDLSGLEAGPVDADAVDREDTYLFPPVQERSLPTTSS